MFYLRSVMISVLCLLPALAHAQHYMPSAKGSTIEFRVNDHKDGLQQVRGTFGQVKGDITFDPKQPARSSFDVSVNVASLHTGDAARDKDLKGPVFFNEILYPTIRIRSSAITTDAPGSIIYTLKGSLIMKGITRPVSIQFTATPMGGGYLFRGSFRTGRQAYGLGPQGSIEDEVTLYIVLKADKK